MERFGVESARLPVESVWTTAAGVGQLSLVHLVDGTGLEGGLGRGALHDNASDGSTMWLGRSTDEQAVSLVFELRGSYPLREMWIWNYNQSLAGTLGLAKRGMRWVSVDYSLDAIDWTRLGGDNHAFELAPATGAPGLPATNLAGDGNLPILFDDVRAQFVRLTVVGGVGMGNWGGVDGQEPFFGLSAVRFYGGTGWAVSPDDAWTTMFSRREGWTGGDGIYSVALESSTIEPEPMKRTFFIFGDTFVGPVDPATDRRLSMTMINNSAALIEGGAAPDRAKAQFLWNQDATDSAGAANSLIVPQTERGAEIEGSYYWLQAGVRVGDSFHCMPLIVGPYPDGPDGFKFSVHGVTVVSVPIRNSGLIWAEEMQCDTTLYRENAEGTASYFGAGIFNNSGNSGDGFVYIYGLRNEQPRGLLVARVSPECFTNVAAWTFWDGQNWSEEMDDAAPIYHRVSAELSVSAIKFQGIQRYVLVHGQGDLQREYVTVAFSETPYGPFTAAERLYYCSHGKETGEYAYNPKAHPAIVSGNGSLLISYNVNTTDWDTHVYHADVYRPRFVDLRWMQDGREQEAGGK